MNLNDLRVARIAATAALAAADKAMKVARRNGDDAALRAAIADHARAERAWNAVS